MKKLLLLITAFVFISQNLFSQTLTQTNFTSVMCPQYMASGTSTRLPVVFRATVTNLSPNTIYRYYSQAGRYTDLGSINPGAGNPLFITANPYRYTTNTSLSTNTGYDSITTNGSGSYTGWFAFVNTGNARFTAGNYVIPTISMRKATDTATIRRALNDSILVLAFATAAGANNGTGIYGISSANPRNLIALYDNTAGTGRPLSMTFVEAMGIDATGLPSLAGFYNDSVITRNGRWGTIIPNTLSTGVRRIAVYSASTGIIANFSTDPDGVWPSGANTVNPSGGTTAIRITGTDAPLTIINNNSIVHSFKLSQNYPNPFNPVTNIDFQLPQSGLVSLKIYNALGMEISNVIDKKLNAGSYTVKFDGKDINSGVYFYTLNYTTGEGKTFNETKKLVLIK